MEKFFTLFLICIGWVILCLVFFRKSNSTKKTVNIPIKNKEEEINPIEKKEVRKEIDFSVMIMMGSDDDVSPEVIADLVINYSDLLNRTWVNKLPQEFLAQNSLKETKSYEITNNSTSIDKEVAVTINDEIEFNVENIPSPTQSFVPTIFEDEETGITIVISEEEEEETDTTTQATDTNDNDSDDKNRIDISGMNNGLLD